MREHNSIFYFILLTSYLFCSIAVAQNEPFNNQIRLAKSFESKGELKEAENIYTDLHNKLPKNLQIYTYLFKNLVSQKKYVEAEKLARKQIDISSNKVNLYGDLGSVIYLIGREEEALQIWEEALDFEPNNPFAYRTIANYLIENRLIEYAIDILERGNTVSEDHTIFSYDIANYYSITMKFEQATKEYCRILESKPTQLTLVKTKIAGYINANLAEEPTLKTVQKWYEDSGNITFLKLLADLYMRTNNNSEAFEAIKIIEMETTRNGSAIFNFAQQASRNGHYNSAAFAYNEIISNYPNSALYSESEIGYTRSLELSLKFKELNIGDWKPLKIFELKDTSSYLNLVSAYAKLAMKYQNNKIGWESEYRSARIYHYTLKMLGKAEGLYNKILNERRSLQYLAAANFGLAMIEIQKGDLKRAKKNMLKVIESKLAKDNLKAEANFFLGKIHMWNGDFSSSINSLNKVTGDPKKEYVNDALQYLLLINTFRKDSTNLLSFAKSDYLLEIGKYDSALTGFKELSENNDLFILKDIASLKYSEILISLNNYQEAGIFLEAISSCDGDNIFKDRFLFLLGSNYYFGLKNYDKATEVLTRLFDEFPNSIYYNKARNIISEINVEVGNTL